MPPSRSRAPFDVSPSDANGTETRARCNVQSGFGRSPIAFLPLQDDMKHRAERIRQPGFWRSVVQRKSKPRKNTMREDTCRSDGRALPEIRPAPLCARLRSRRRASWKECAGAQYCRNHPDRQRRSMALGAVPWVPLPKATSLDPESSSCLDENHHASQHLRRGNPLSLRRGSPVVPGCPKTPKTALQRLRKVCKPNELTGTAGWARTTDLRSHNPNDHGIWQFFMFPVGSRFIDFTDFLRYNDF